MNRNNRLRGSIWAWVVVFGISIGLFASCGQEGMDSASFDSNSQSELLSNQTLSDEFIFVPKGSEVNFSALDSYPRGTMDLNSDLLEDYDAIPLDSNGSFEYEFVPNQDGTQFLGVASSAVPGSGRCCYTRCSTWTVNGCGNWLFGYYDCCTATQYVCVACAV